MIRTDRQYQELKTRLYQEKKALAEQRRHLEALKLSPEKVKRGMDPLLTLHYQLAEELEWYERVKKGDFEPITDLTQMGRTLIALRIASGLSQKDLARKLGIPESQVSRDERNEYHAISLDRAQKILSALGANLKVKVDLGQRAA
jgi:ribosome-binding protein aMBF1 (putative translation factor)